MKSVGMYGRNGSSMIANIIVGMGIITLLGFVIYGMYMAIWGVYDEFH